jgi:hypothetical protein
MKGIIMPFLRAFVVLIITACRTEDKFKQASQLSYGQQNPDIS